MRRSRCMRNTSRCSPSKFRRRATQAKRTAACVELRVAARGVTADLYTSDEYARRHPDWHRSDSPWKAAQVLAMLQRHGLVPRTVVEVGCGAGGILAELQKNLPAATHFTG